MQDPVNPGNIVIKRGSNDKALFVWYRVSDPDIQAVYERRRRVLEFPGINPEKGSDTLVIIEKKDKISLNNTRFGKIYGLIFRTKYFDIADRCDRHRRRLSGLGSDKPA